MRKIWIIAMCVVLLISLTPAPAASSTTDVVKGKKEYTYLMMERDLIALEKAYPKLVSLHRIGRTQYERNIYALQIGRGSAAVFINAAHHAREYFTTAVAMNQIQDLLNRQAKDADLADLLQHVSIWVVPMVNPDGVSLSQHGLSSFPHEAHEKLLRMNEGSSNFKNWKANAEGIDLNRQYPADWENIIMDPGKPSSYNYKGSKPLQTMENQALIKLTYEINPQLTISNHSTGRIIFWNFHTLEENVQRDRRLALQLSDLTGYSLVKPTPNPSGGGYTDWFIQTFARPAFTIEMAPSNGGKPVALKYFEEEWERNSEVMLWAAKSAYSLWLASQQPHFVEVDRTIDLTSSVKLYREPNRSTYTYAKLNQASIKVKGQWDHWFLVDTWAGERYIYMPDEPLLPQHQIIELTEKTPIYRYPSELAPAVAVIEPQRITSIIQTLDWAKVDTWLGEMWIQLPSIYNEQQ